MINNTNNREKIDKIRKLVQYRIKLLREFDGLKEYKTKIDKIKELNGKSRNT